MTRKDFEKWVPQAFTNGNGGAQTQVDVEREGVTNQEKAMLYDRRGFDDPLIVVGGRQQGKTRNMMDMGAKHIPSPQHEGTDLKVNALQIFRGRLYAATDHGVYEYDPATEVWRRMLFVDQKAGAALDVTA